MSILSRYQLHRPRYLSPRWVALGSKAVLKAKVWSATAAKACTRCHRHPPRCVITKCTTIPDFQRLPTTVGNSKASNYVLLLSTIHVTSLPNLHPCCIVSRTRPSTPAPTLGSQVVMQVRVGAVQRRVRRRSRRPRPKRNPHPTQ